MILVFNFINLSEPSFADLFYNLILSNFFVYFLISFELNKGAG